MTFIIDTETIFADRFARKQDEFEGGIIVEKIDTEEIRLELNGVSYTYLSKEQALQLGNLLTQLAKAKFGVTYDIIFLDLHSKHPTNEKNI